MDNITIEQLLLSSIVNTPNLFVDINDAVKPVMFTNHRREWAEKIWDKLTSGENVSFHSIAMDYSDEHFNELNRIFFEYANSDGMQLALKLKEGYLKKQGGEIFAKAQQDLVKGEQFTSVINTTNNQIEELTKMGTPTGKNLERYDVTKQSILNPNIKIDKIPTGFTELDKKLGGLPIGMNLFAARPGMGKTTLVLWFLIYAIRSGRPCLFYSLEMTLETILQRLACYFAGYNANDYERLGQKQREQVAEEIEKLKEMPLWIRDSEDFSGKVEDLHAEVFVMKKKHNIQLVAFDYLQLSETYQKTNGQYEKTNILSGTIRKAAQKSKLPWVVLSQLSRAVEIRGGDKRPILSDLRDSGKIEEDSVSVTFIYRPEYYGIMKDEDGHSLQGITELIFAKFRPDGSVVNKSALLKFNPGTGEFKSFDPDFEDEPYPTPEPSPIIKPQTRNDDEDIEIPF